MIQKAEFDGIESDNAADVFKVGACAYDFPEETVRAGETGALDQVWIYDKRLSTLEVKDIYGRADAVAGGSLALWWVNIHVGPICF